MRDANLEIVIFAVLCEFDYDVAMGSVAFPCGSEVRWPHDSSICWFPYSWDIAEISSVPILKWVTNEGTIGRARGVGEEYEEIRVFVQAESSPISVADGKRQLAEFCAGDDCQGSDGGEKDPDGVDGMTARFQSQFEELIASRTNVVDADPSTLGDISSLAMGHSQAVAGRLKE